MELQLVSYETLLFVGSLFSLVGEGRTIKCLKCFSSSEDPCARGQVDAEECNPPADYCMKYTGQMNNGPTIFRDCSLTREKNVCGDKIIKGRKTYVCAEYCDYNGCNGGAISSAHNFKPSNMLILIILLQCLLHMYGLEQFHHS